MKGLNETAMVVAPVAADVVSDINWQTGETEEDIGVLVASSNLRSIGKTEWLVTGEIQASAKR